MHKLTMPGNKVALVFKNFEFIHRNTHLILRVTPLKNQFGQILIIASKKIGNAVIRNLIKRRIRSIFREEKLYQLNRDIIVTCKTGIDKLSYQDLKNTFKSSIYSLLKRAH